MFSKQAHAYYVFSLIIQGIDFLTLHLYMTQTKPLNRWAIDEARGEWVLGKANTGINCPLTSLLFFFTAGGIKEKR